MASLMFSITNEENAYVKTIRANIPETLAIVIQKALVKNVEPRFPSGAGFADALKIFLKI